MDRPFQVRFFDLDRQGNPLDDTPIRSEAEAASLLESLADRAPFFFELVANNGETVLVGLGPEASCVQWSATDGRPPYLMAQESASASNDESLSFLIGGQTTAVPSSYRLTRATLSNVIAGFVRDGSRAPEVAWEEI